MNGHRQEGGQRPERGPRPERAPESVLAEERLQIERKSFVFQVKENARGKFVRVIEEVNGMRDSIVIPATGLDEFVAALAKVRAKAGV